MLMTFSRERYMHRTLGLIKKHTIRADPKCRWREGMTAHMWMHSPRNVKKNPFQFATAIVSCVLPIEISKENHTIKIGNESIGNDSWASLDQVAKNDGFDNAVEFFDWFGEFTGRIIFWRDLKPFPEVQ